MKLGNLISVMDVFNIMVGKQLKPSVGYKISIFVKNAEPEYTLFIKTRNEIIQRFGESEDGENYRIKAESMDEYKKVMDELLETEVDINPPKIKLSELDNIELEGRHMYILSETVIVDDMTN